MRMIRSRIAAVLCVASVALACIPAQAEDFFVPNAPRPAAQQPQRPAARPAPSAASSASPGPVGGALPSIIAPGADADVPTSPPAQLPPFPALPPLAKVAPPPAAVIGVIGVPEIMRASLAAQAVDRIIGERRDRLNEDAQKEQAAWRDMQQHLASQRSSMSPEQAAAKDRELRDRIATAQKQFRDRARIIQEAAQYGVGQIERALVAVIRQVAESHGMNLVLHRSQVALNVPEFDISEPVANQLNAVLPSVVIPPDGVSPSALPGGGAGPMPPPADGPRR